jgi:hypothetical protein
MYCFKTRAAGATSALPRPTAEEIPLGVDSSARVIDAMTQSGIRQISALLVL